MDPEMTVNSSVDSSVDTVSLHPLYSTLNSSLHYYSINPCFRSEHSVFIFSVLSTLNLLLLLPFFIFVLCMGYQQWRRQRRVPTATTSQSNVFIYHSIAMELNVSCGFTCFYCGGFFDDLAVMLIGLSIWKVTYLGQGLFHILTCVERYLAVVHPITYLHLRRAGEVRIRNVSVACVWLLTAAWLVIGYLTSSAFYFVLYSSCMSIVFAVIAFCSVSVLCALRRPGPGEVGGNKKRVDQSKQRAFVNISLIMGVLMLRFMGNLITNVIFNLAVVDPKDACVALLSTNWLDLPSSLVLPLLFLQRIGKLPRCKQKSESG